MSLNQKWSEILKNILDRPKNGANRRLRSRRTYETCSYSIQFYHRYFILPGEGLVSDNFEQNNQLFATEHDFTPKNLKKLDKCSNENNFDDSNELGYSKIRRVQVKQKQKCAHGHPKIRQTPQKRRIAQNCHMFSIQISF